MESINQTKTRGPYIKRFHKTLFTTSQKTNTPEGRREYQRQWVALKRASKRSLN